MHLHWGVKDIQDKESPRLQFVLIYGRRENSDTMRKEYTIVYKLTQ